MERKTLELLRTKVEKASKILSKLTEEEITRSIRESRDERWAIRLLGHDELGEEERVG